MPNNKPKTKKQPKNKPSAKSKKRESKTNFVVLPNVPVRRNYAFRHTPARIQTRGSVAHVQHTELLTYINASGFASGTKSFRINPGLEDAFPWLASFAVKYQKYRFKSLSFTYIPTFSTSHDGNVSMVFETDSSKLFPVDVSHLYDQTGYKEYPIYKRFTYKPEVSTFGQKPGAHLLTRDILVTSELNTYDAGYLTIATSDTANPGKVFVTYDIELILPQSPDRNGSGQGNSQAGVATCSSEGKEGIGPGDTSYPGIVITSDGDLPVTATNGEIRAGLKGNYDIRANTCINPNAAVPGRTVNATLRLERSSDDGNSWFQYGKASSDVTVNADDAKNISEVAFDAVISLAKNDKIRAAVYNGLTSERLDYGKVYMDIMSAL